MGPSWPNDSYSSTPSQGEDGLVGFSGQSGPQGQPGERGPKGKQGKKGLSGDNGIPGPFGLKGQKGAQGTRGPAGNPGRDGFDGAKGAQGKAGSQGSQGLPGTKVHQPRCSARNTHLCCWWLCLGIGGVICSLFCTSSAGLNLPLYSSITLQASTFQGAGNTRQGLPLPIVCAVGAEAFSGFSAVQFSETLPLACDTKEWMPWIENKGFYVPLVFLLHNRVSSIWNPGVGGAQVCSIVAAQLSPTHTRSLEILHDKHALQLSPTHTRSLEILHDQPCFAIEPHLHQKFGAGTKYKTNNCSFWTCDVCQLQNGIALLYSCTGRGVRNVFKPQTYLYLHHCCMQVVPANLVSFPDP